MGRRTFCRNNVCRLGKGLIGFISILSFFVGLQPNTQKFSPFRKMCKHPMHRCRRTLSPFSHYTMQCETAYIVVKCLFDIFAVFGCNFILPRRDVGIYFLVFDQMAPLLWVVQCVLLKMYRQISYSMRRSSQSKLILAKKPSFNSPTVKYASFLF